MCKAIDDLIEDGKAEGRREIVHTIRRKLDQGLSVREIASWMDLEEEYVQETADMSGRYPREDDLYIAKRLLGIED